MKEWHYGLSSGDMGGESTNFEINSDSSVLQPMQIIFAQYFCIETKASLILLFLPPIAFFSHVKKNNSKNKIIPLLKFVSRCLENAFNFVIKFVRTNYSLHYENCPAFLGLNCLMLAISFLLVMNLKKY